MARYSSSKIEEFFQRRDAARTTTEKGRALEDLICYIFGKVPGIPITKRNTMNAFGTEEIDVAFWNDRSEKGLYYLPNVILVECKNWSRPVGSAEVAYFVKKLENKGLDFGVLIAVNGITGSSSDATAANFEVSMALARGIRLIVITREEIERLAKTDDLARLFKVKLCKLALSGAAQNT